MRNENDIAAEVKKITDGQGVDIALDAVGGEAFTQSLKAAGHGGRVVAMANVALAPTTMDTRDFYPKNVRISGFQLTNLIQHGWDPRPDLRELIAAVGAQRFTVPIDTTVPLAEATQAHLRLESGDTRGKVTLHN